MEMTAKPSALLFLSCLLFFGATLALSYEGEDPRLRQCKQQCRDQQGYQPRQERQCEQQCEEYYGQRHDRGGKGEAEQQLEQCQRQCTEGRRSESQQRECKQRCQDEYRRQQEGGNDGIRGRDPEQQLEQCQEQCRRQRAGQQQQQACKQRCQDEYRRQREEGRGGEGNPESESQRGVEEERNPFFFSPERFIERIRTQEGHYRLLERFAEKSEMLNGIDLYRFGFLEANPNTLVIPHHCDAESVIYITDGRGTVNVLRKENRESYNVRRGDILRVHAGSVVSIINSDNNEKLRIAKILLPVFSLGRYEEFYGPGGEDPESFYRTFSSEILEAAFNVPKEKLDRVLRQQRKGAIIKASPEQIRGLSARGSSSEGRGESRGPYNLLSQRPTHANQHGQLYQAYPKDCEQLRELNIAMSLANISRGSMEAPMYNSRATQISLVLDGSGRYEMACPHISESGQQREEEKGGQQAQRGQRYQRVSARLSPGAVFVVPAGHPTTIVASGDKNLQIVSFELNAHGNERIFLAGQNNILNRLEQEAKELSFNVPAKEVDEVFQARKESFFLPGPNQSHGGRGEHGAFESILDFVGF